MKQQMFRSVYFLEGVGVDYSLKKKPHWPLVYLAVQLPFSAATFALINSENFGRQHSSINSTKIYHCMCESIIRIEFSSTLVIEYD